jgi:hypothetical protein
MNYSLRTLLIFTAVFAIVVACLVFPEPLVGDLFYTLGLLMIAIAVLAAIYFRGPIRAYWIGFVLLFAGYYAHTVWPSEIRSTWTMVQTMGGLNYPAQGLISSRLISAAYEGLHGPFTAQQGFRPGRAFFPAGGDVGKYVAFMTVGHTVIALLLGLVGGAIAQRFAMGAAVAKRGADETSTP